MNITQTMMTPAKFIRLANTVGTFRLGWNDAAHGKPYRADYETWDSVKQAHYERGRLAALDAGATRGYSQATRAMARAVAAAQSSGAIPPSAVR